MNTLDIVLCVLIAYGLIRGSFRGLIKEITSILGVGGGFYAAYTYYPMLAEPLAAWLSHPNSRWADRPEYANIIAFILLFCGVFVAVALIGVGLKSVLKIAHFGWVDHLFGAVFGGTKGVLLAAVLVFALAFFLPSGRSPIIEQSIVAPKVTMATEVMARFVPPEMKNMFNEKIEYLKEVWKDRV